MSEPTAATELRHPSAGILVGDGTAWVSNTSRHEVAQVDLTTGTVLRRGGGDLLREPYGLTALPPLAAKHLGCTVVVASAGNHTLVGLTLPSAPSSPITARRLAGTRQQ